MPLFTNVEPYTSNKEVMKSATCDTCGNEVKLCEFSENVPARNDWSNVQITDGLVVTLDGGYYSYFDGPAVRLLVCQACIEKLISTFPALSGRMVGW